MRRVGAAKGQTVETSRKEVESGLKYNEKYGEFGKMKRIRCLGQNV